MPERSDQQVLRIEMIGVLWAAGAIAELFDAIALHDQEPARPQAGVEAFEHDPTQLGRSELHEDRDDEIVGLGLPLPFGEIGKHGLQADAATAGEFARLGKADRRSVDRHDVEAALGEPDAVTALSIGHCERLHAWLKPEGLRGKKGVRLSPEQIVFTFESTIPIVLHGSRPSGLKGFRLEETEACFC